MCGNIKIVVVKGDKIQVFVIDFKIVFVIVVVRGVYVVCL